MKNGQVQHFRGSYSLRRPSLRGDAGADDVAPVHGSYRPDGYRAAGALEYEADCWYRCGDRHVKRGMMSSNLKLKDNLVIIECSGCGQLQRMSGCRTR